MTNTQNIVSKCQVAAILLMTAGWGWIGGNFTPSDAPIWNFLLHCIPILLLLVMGTQVFRMSDAHQQAETTTGRANLGVSIFAIVSIVGCIVLIALGASNPDPNAVGVKTFADWFPTIILNIGTFLWLGTLIVARRKNTETTIASNV